MPQLLLLAKLSVIFLLVPAYKCVPISDSAESKLSEVLTTVQPTDSKLLPFLHKQQSSQSLHGPLISSPTYKLATTLSEPSKSSIFQKGQESSLYLQESQSKKSPHLPLYNSNLISEIEALLSKPQLSDLVVPLDASVEYQNPWKDVALSNTVPFLNTKSSNGPQISSSTYKAAAQTILEPSKSSILSKGQESSLYLQKFDSENPPLLPSFNSNLISEVVSLSSKPQLSATEVPLDKSFQYRNAWKGVEFLNKIPFFKAKLTVCELKKLLLKGIQSSTDYLKNPKFHVRIPSTNYVNHDQQQSTRTKARKIKIKVKPDEPSQLANDWYGSHKNKESLVKTKQSSSKKFKVFSTHEQAMKFKEKLKQNVKNRKIPKKVKIYPGNIEPLKKSWRNRDNISSRKSKTQRCYKTRKQDDNSSRTTVCVTYPASWGNIGTPYAYYYPYYYYPYYYYPYYYYGRR